MGMKVLSVKTRQDRFDEFFAKLVDYNGPQVRDLEKNPKRFLVAEYDHEDLNWMYTVNTLADAEEMINGRTSTNVTVVDLDTGEEFNVFFTARIEQK